MDRAVGHYAKKKKTKKKARSSLRRTGTAWSHLDVESKTVKLRTSSAIQWLRLHASITGDTGSNPAQGTKICVARPISKIKQSNSEKQRVAWRVPGAGGWAWRGVCRWFPVSVTEG